MFAYPTDTAVTSLRHHAFEPELAALVKQALAVAEELRLPQRSVLGARDEFSKPSLAFDVVCFLAATYAQLGQMVEARADAAEALRVQPSYTITGTGRRIMGFKSAEDAQHYFDGLRQAGLPE